MARSSKLKIFRTAIGFHDAYVAAPSKKAALEAWGTNKDLFSRGVAELVTDKKLTAEPLANPGKVIKRARGTNEEHLAALSKTKASSRRKPEPEPKATTRPQLKGPQGWRTLLGACGHRPDLGKGR